MAIACLVERAPCLPSRICSISSRMNSPACVVGALPSRSAWRACSMVFCSGMIHLPVIRNELHGYERLAFFLVKRRDTQPSEIRFATEKQHKDNGSNGIPQCDFTAVEATSPPAFSRGRAKV